MGKSAVLGSVMGKQPTARLLAIEAALYGAHPQRAVRLHVHGIHGIAGEGARVAVLMRIVHQFQLAGSKLHDAARLSAYPDLSVLAENAIHEVAAQAVYGTQGVPLRNMPAMPDIQKGDSSQSANHQPAVRRDGQGADKAVQQPRRSIPPAAVAAEKPLVAGKPRLSAKAQYASEKPARSLRVKRREIPGQQLSSVRCDLP